MAPSCNDRLHISHYRKGACVHRFRPRRLDRQLGTTEIRTPGKSPGTARMVASPDSASDRGQSRPPGNDPESWIPRAARVAERRANDARQPGPARGAQAELKTRVFPLAMCRAMV